MKAKDLMTQNPEIISPETPLKQAAEKMRDQDIGFLPIGENDRLIGTIRDVATKSQDVKLTSNVTRDVSEDN